MKTNFQRLMTGISISSFVASIIIGIDTIVGHGNSWFGLILLIIGIITSQFSDDIV